MADFSGKPFGFQIWKACFDYTRRVSEESLNRASKTLHVGLKISHLADLEKEIGTFLNVKISQFYGFVLIQGGFLKHNVLRT